MDVSACITIWLPFNDSLTRSHRYAFKRHDIFDQRKMIILIIDWRHVENATA